MEPTSGKILNSTSVVSDLTSQGISHPLHPMFFWMSKGKDLF